ncbi:MAG: RNA 2',3'-cyclic phosphodiesterase [Candidatus Korarchaeota archaeon]|nr:RNA 2',3'-cyclic phosphodiesterase [Candidatus Korarchaeota archaeon]
MGIRSFIAIDVEDPEIVSKIVRVQEEILSSSARLRPVERQNLHLTLKFLGNVEESRIELVASTMREVLESFEPFPMHLKGVGAFPRVSRPNVVWIGVDEGRDIFIEMAKELDRSLAKLGFKRETKGFEPHLTIARVKGYSGDLPEIIRRISDFDIGFIDVDEVRLKKSTLTSQGPIYETLYSIKLRQREEVGRE